MSFADVPFHRPSVGAMFVGGGSQMPTPINSFQPYVYRGTGEDIYSVVDPRWAKEADEKAAVPKPKPKPKPKRKRKPKPKPKPKPRPPAKPKPPRKTPEELAAIRAAATEKAKATVARKREARIAEAQERRRQRELSQPHAAPGWIPTKGDDIDALLEELNDD